MQADENEKKIVDSSDDDEQKSLEDYLIRLIALAADPGLDFWDPEDLQQYERSVDEAAEIIINIGRVSFSHIAPPLKQHYEAPTDLHHRLFPDTFDFCMETIHDAVFMIPITPGEAAWPRNDGGPDPNFKTNFEPDPQMPSYSTKYITFVKKYREAFIYGLEFKYLASELITLRKIEEANVKLESPLRIPLLKGYVVHATTEQS
ncbi:protein kinaselike domain protein [Fusarium sporotrichioides]|uniref:Protein kinaselike domain protein n=1 Tax=Fusarium sporotrichioides TaxID=5514 RepID=A0A395RR15_FUSSP|nr:protein kinaselike domain protein [Fusarium sporotrichioides]